MESHSYQVIAKVESALDADAVAVANAPRLVILGGNSIDSAAAEVTAVRQLWPDAKIALLFEQASDTDLNRLQRLRIDASHSFGRVGGYSCDHAEKDPRRGTLGIPR
jgi:hypothetical protein